MAKTIPNKSGVYKITNLDTDETYVGSAANLRTRKNHHFHKLDKGIHANKNLQKAYDEYGKDKFKFEIIMFCESDELLEYEQEFIDSMEPEYNEAPTAGSMEGYSHSPETKTKISISTRKSKGVGKADEETIRNLPMPDLNKKTRVKAPDPRSIRNLAQYKDMSDEEFDALYYKKYILELQENKDFEVLIENKMKEFEKDYDLTDMKFNDLETLRALCQSVIFLEIFEQHSFTLMENLNVSNLTMLDKLESWKSNLRKSISDLQGDLQITRKTRKSEQSQSVIEEIDRLKAKAKEYYEQKMAYTFCPDCDMLLHVGWFKDPQENNTLKLVCKRCDEEYGRDKYKVVKTVDMYKDTKVSNKEDIPQI